MNRDSEKIRIFLKRSMEMLTIMAFAFLLIIVRLIYLQIIEADRYKMMSDKNRISLRILPPFRGGIYDRNGVELATNAQAFKVSVIPEQTPDLEEILHKLAEVISLDDAEISTVLTNARRTKKFMPIKIKDGLSWQDVSAIELHAADLPGVVVDEEFERRYKDGEYFAHILGYVGSVSKDDNKTSDPLLMLPDFKVGKSGVEKKFEDVLRGKSGNIKFEVNALGRMMKNIDREEPTTGENIYTSIDSRLQKKAYEAFGDESGALVLMNIHTGEVLAYVSVPSFDPNLFVEGMRYNTWNNLVSNPKDPLSDKVVSGVYSPGSTFKMMTALAGLNAGVINAENRVFCSGKFELGDHAFHCWKHSGHGSLNVVEALERSCDVYFYDLSLKVGIDSIAEVSREFGLGEVTGTGFDIEKTGVIPDKKWKQKKFGNNWRQGESVIASIGQGYVTVTPLQLAVMTARIANGKEKVVPSLIRLNKKPEFEPLKISTRHLNIVREGMYRVVNSSFGTAKRAAFYIHGAKMAGKTGTTQVRRISMKERMNGIIRDENLPWKLRNHALFVGYAPYDNPLYAVAVVVEHGSSGSSVAAPIASKVMQEAIILNSAR